jgi:uncharacterized protein DUF1629
MKYAFDEAAFRARQELWMNDPRAIDLKQEYDFYPASVDLLAENAVKLGEGRFFQLEAAKWYDQTVRWVNEENGGRYRFGLAEVVAHLRTQSTRPRFEQLTRPPKKHPDGMEFGRYFLLSDRVVEVIRRMDPSAIETREAELAYLRGELGPRYHLVVFTRHLMAEDYSRSLVRVELHKGMKSVKWMVPRAFHADIDPEVHAFVCHYAPNTVYVSRELAMALAAIGPWKIRFLDPAGHYDIVEFEGLESHWED